MDLTKFSTEDLMAMKAGDLSKVSTAGLQMLKQDTSLHEKIAAQIADDPISRGARGNATDGMSGFDKFQAGWGQAVSNLGQGIGQWVGATDRADVAESRRLDEPLMQSGAAKVGSIIGNAATMALIALIPGVNTIAGGVAAGAINGLAQPSTSTRETAINTGFGAATGAIVPLAQKAWQLTKAAAEPLHAAGQDAIVGRVLNKAAGKDAPAVAKRLEEAGTPFTGPSQGVPRTVVGEYVPGSIPTVGQAAENAGVAALERSASAGNPAVTNAISDTMKAQNAARTGVLQELSGTQGAREFFDANRKAAAQQLYEKAYKAGLPKFTTAEEAIVTDLMNRPAIKSAVGEAKTLAANEGDNITEAAGSVKGLDYVKRALDDQIGKATPGSNEQRILTGLKDKLTGFLDSVSPDYAAARTTFKEMSRPINQMDVVKTIADKSVAPLSGNMQPAAYAKALSDKSAQQATGFGKATLENTLEPQQLNALNSILLDVQRSTGAQNAGRGVGSDTLQKLAYTNLLDQAGMPTFLRELKPAQVVGNFAGRAADAVYGRANREISNRLAEVMLDPAAAAALMQRVTPTQRNQLQQILSRTLSGAALAAPATTHALEQ